MHCTMHSIPASALNAGGTVPGQPENLFPRPLDESFNSVSFSKSSVFNTSLDFSSSRFSDIGSTRIESSRFADMVEGSRRIDCSRLLEEYEEEEGKERPLVLRNKAPRWHEQLQCWCLNFRGRVTVASVKNFQLIAATQPAAGAPTPSQPVPPEHDKISYCSSVRSLRICSLWTIDIPSRPFRLSQFV